MAIHAEDLRRFLSETTGRPINLRINDNTHSVINTTRDGAGPGLRLSLHRIFLDADEQTIHALAGFITKPTPTQRRVIREFINTNSGRIGATVSQRAPRVIRGSGHGKVYQLEPRAAAINERHFNGALKFRIIWGKAVRAGKRQRHVTLGTWNDRQGIIRINPLLDHDRVPEYFLDYIIFHEMTHIAVPTKTGCSGRRHIHTPEFYATERTFPQYDLAIAWEKRYLFKLIRSWNGGAEFKGPMFGKTESINPPEQLTEPKESKNKFSRGVAEIAGEVQDFLKDLFGR